MLPSLSAMTIQPTNQTDSMKITITHAQSSIDPNGTITDSAFPAAKSEFERQITAAIGEEYPEADVWFVEADPCGNGIDIDGGDPSGDIAEEIACIINKIYEAGHFWPAA